MSQCIEEHNDGTNHDEQVCKRHVCPAGPYSGRATERRQVPDKPRHGIHDLELREEDGEEEHRSKCLVTNGNKGAGEKNINILDATK